jgi:LacI family transcriptional regulator
MACFYPELVDAISQEATRHGVTIASFCSHDDLATEQQLVQRQIAAGMGGVMIALALCDSERTPESLEWLTRQPVPVIVLDHLTTKRPLANVDYVVKDHYAGIYESTVHLIRHGFRKIALVNSEPAAQYELLERGRAYRAAMEDHGLSLPELEPLTPRIDVEIDPPSKLFEAYLAWGVEAFVATNDNTASFLLTRLADRGVKVPDEVGVIGFDDEPYAATLRPPLSSVRVDKAKMARHAVKLMRERVKDNSGGHKMIVVRPTVVPRASCGLRCPDAQPCALPPDDAGRIEQKELAT